MRAGRWLALVVAAMLAAPAGAGAAARRPAGNFYAGFTPQQWPVVVQVTRSARQVTRMMIGLDFTCTVGRQLGSDSFRHVPIARSGRFASTYSNQRVDNDDGTFTVYDGGMSARLNRSRTKISGTWRERYVEHDATGAVTNTCSSPTVHWVARQ